MFENHKSYMLGKVKVVLGRLSNEDEWEVLNLTFWNDRFQYDLESTSYGYEEECLRNMSEEYTEVLREHATGDGLQVFEVIADLHHESWKTWTDCGYEHDAREWLENIRVREIKGRDLKYFKYEDPFRWKDFYGEEPVTSENA